MHMACEIPNVEMCIRSCTADAWNTKLNIGPRKLSLEAHSCCCCMFGVHAFDETKKESSLILSRRFRGMVWYINTFSFVMQIILYITVLAIVVDQLDIPAEGGEDQHCLLDQDPSNMSLCLYIYAMSGIGMFFTLVCCAIMVRHGHCVLCCIFTYASGEEQIRCCLLSLFVNYAWYYSFNELAVILHATNKIQEDCGDRFHGIHGIVFNYRINSDYDIHGQG